MLIRDTKRWSWATNDGRSCFFPLLFTNRYLVRTRKFSTGCYSLPIPTNSDVWFLGMRPNKNKITDVALILWVKRWIVSTDNGPLSLFGIRVLTEYGTRDMTWIRGTETLPFWGSPITRASRHLTSQDEWTDLRVYSCLQFISHHAYLGKQTRAHWLYG